MTERGKKIDLVKWALTHGVGLVYTAIHATVLAVYILTLVTVLHIVSWWEKIR